MKRILRAGVLSLVAGALAFGQQSQPQQPPIDPQQPPPEYQRQAPPDYRQAPPEYQGQRQGPPNRGYQNGPYQAPPVNTMPPTGDLTLPAGTLISVRMNQPLSSDHNQPGDGFTATLQQPLVAGGYVIAR